MNEDWTIITVENTEKNSPKNNRSFDKLEKDRRRGPPIDSNAPFNCNVKYPDDDDEIPDNAPIYEGPRGGTFFCTNYSSIPDERTATFAEYLKDLDGIPDSTVVEEIHDIDDIQIGEHVNIELDEGSALGKVVENSEEEGYFLVYSNVSGDYINVHYEDMTHVVLGDDIVPQSFFAREDYQDQDIGDFRDRFGLDNDVSVDRNPNVEDKEGSTFILETDFAGSVPATLRSIGNNYEFITFDAKVGQKGASKIVLSEDEIDDSIVAEVNLGLSSLIQSMYYIDEGDSESKNIVDTSFDKLKFNDNIAASVDGEGYIQGIVYDPPKDENDFAGIRIYNPNGSDRFRKIPKGRVSSIGEVRGDSTGVSSVSFNQDADFLPVDYDDVDIGEDVIWNTGSQQIVGRMREDGVVFDDSKFSQSLDKTDDGGYIFHVKNQEIELATTDSGRPIFPTDQGSLSGVLKNIKSHHIVPLSQEEWDPIEALQRLGPDPEESSLRDLADDYYERVDFRNETPWEEFIKSIAQVSEDLGSREEEILDAMFHGTGLYEEIENNEWKVPYGLDHCTARRRMEKFEEIEQSVEMAYEDLSKEIIAEMTEDEEGYIDGSPHPIDLSFNDERKKRHEENWEYFEKRIKNRLSNSPVLQQHKNEIKEYPGNNLTDSAYNKVKDIFKTHTYAARDYTTAPIQFASKAIIQGDADFPKYRGDAHSFYDEGDDPPDSLKTTFDQSSLDSIDDWKDYYYLRLLDRYEDDAVVDKKYEKLKETVDEDWIEKGNVMIGFRPEVSQILLDDVQAQTKLVKEVMEYHREALKDSFGEYIPGWRAIGGPEVTTQAQDIIESDEDEVELQHNASSSWTTSPMKALQYGNSTAGGKHTDFTYSYTIVRDNIPVDEVLAFSNILKPLNTSNQSEIIRGSEGSININSDDITTARSLGEDPSETTFTLPEDPHIIEEALYSTIPGIGPSTLKNLRTQDRDLSNRKAWEELDLTDLLDLNVGGISIGTAIKMMRGSRENPDIINLTETGNIDESIELTNKQMRDLHEDEVYTLEDLWKVDKLDFGESTDRQFSKFGNDKANKRYNELYPGRGLRNKEEFDKSEYPDPLVEVYENVDIVTNKQVQEMYENSEDIDTLDDLQNLPSILPLLAEHEIREEDYPLDDTESLDFVVSQEEIEARKRGEEDRDLEDYLKQCFSVDPDTAKAIEAYANGEDSIAQKHIDNIKQIKEKYTDVGEETVEQVQSYMEYNTPDSIRGPSKEVEGVKVPRHTMLNNISYAFEVLTGSRDMDKNMDKDDLRTIKPEPGSESWISASNKLQQQGDIPKERSKSLSAPNIKQIRNIQYMDTDNVISELDLNKSVGVEIIENQDIRKWRVYVDYAHDIPDWARRQEGPRGGVYYEVNDMELVNELLNPPYHEVENPSEYPEIHDDDESRQTVLPTDTEPGQTAIDQYSYEDKGAHLIERQDEKEQEYWRVYVDDEKEAPEWATVSGPSPEGNLYYIVFDEDLFAELVEEPQHEVDDYDLNEYLSNYEGENVSVEKDDIILKRKFRIYVESNDDVPDWARSYEGSRGGIFYVVYNKKLFSELMSSPKHEISDDFNLQSYMYSGRDQESKTTNKSINIVNLEKRRIYIESPTEAPDGKQVHQGDKGGYYYIAGSKDEDEEENEENDSFTVKLKQALKEDELDEIDCSMFVNELDTVMDEDLLEEVYREETREAVRREIESWADQMTKYFEFNYTSSGPQTTKGLNFHPQVESLSDVNIDKDQLSGPDKKVVEKWEELKERSSDVDKVDTDKRREFRKTAEKVESSEVLQYLWERGLGEFEDLNTHISDILHSRGYSPRTEKISGTLRRLDIKYDYSINSTEGEVADAVENGDILRRIKQQQICEKIQEIDNADMLNDVKFAALERGISEDSTVIKQINKRISEIDCRSVETFNIKYNTYKDILSRPAGFSGPGQGVNYNAWKSVWENISTDDLKEFSEAADNRNNNAHCSIVNGLLCYRSDVDISARDLVDINYVNGGVSEEELYSELERILAELNPVIGACLLSQLDTIRSEKLDTNKQGYALFRGMIGVDMPDQNKDSKRFLLHHLIGHILHEIMGLDVTEDNPEEDEEELGEGWRYTVMQPKDEENDYLQEFFEKMRKEWKRYTSKDSMECRIYQRTDPKEFMACTFALWCADKRKLSSIHPEMESLYNKKFGGEEWHE